MNDICQEINIFLNTCNTHFLKPFIDQQTADISWPVFKTKPNLINNKIIHLN